MPIVAYGKSDELKRIIEESNAGIYIDNNNEKEIGNSLIKLLSDEEKLKKYSENGRKFMEQKIDFSFMKEI